jgi:hypothetical protein
VLDIQGISSEYFGMFLRYPNTRKDIPKQEILEWDIPKLMNDRSRVSFFVLARGYLSLSNPILVPILFSKSCLAQSNDCYISLPTVQTPFTEHMYFYLCIQVLLPFPRPACLGKAAGAGQAGARFTAPPRPHPTCSAERGVGRLDALAFGVGVGVSIVAAVVGQHRHGCCRAKAAGPSGLGLGRRPCHCSRDSHCRLLAWTDSDSSQ